MQEHSTQDIYKKIVMRAKIYSKLYQVKHYSKISKLNYNAFINKLELAKKIYTTHQSFYEHLQKYAYECKNIYQEEVAKLHYNPEVLNFACYKMLEKEIKQGKNFNELSDMYYEIVNVNEIIKYYDGINCALSALHESAYAPKKEKELEK